MSIVYLPHLGASVALQSGSLGGNTSGASTFFGSNVVWAGGSNVTLQASSDTIYIHGASAGTATGGGGGAGTDWAITGGSITVNTSGGTISLPAYLTTAAPPGALTTAAQSDHSHGALSLVNLTGTSASNGLTLSAAAPGGGGAIAVTAGTSSGNLQTLAFSNSNGVSFGLNGSTVTASHDGYTGATTQFLTTSPRLDEIRNPTTDAVLNMNTRQFQMQWGTNFTTWASGAGRQGLFELDFAATSFTDAAANVDVVHIHQSNATNSPIDLLHLQAAATNATLLRLDAGGSFAGEINAPLKFTAGSVPLILGTSQSNVVSNLNAFYLEGTRGSDYAARTHTHSQYQSTGAYLTTAAISNHSHAFATTSTTGASIVVGTSNSAGATIGVPAYLTTAQPVGAYLTTARASNDAVGLATAGTSVTWTVNSAGISLNAGAYLTTAANSTHTHGNGSLALTNLSGTTASASNGWTISLSAAAPGGGGLGTNTAGTNITWTANTSGLSINASGYAGTGTSGTQATFTLNSNGLAFNGGAYLTTAAQSGHSHGNPTLNLTNLSGTTASASNGFTLSLSAAAPGGGAAQTFSAGTASGSANPIYFSNANGVTFGLGTGASSSVVTASVNAGGGAAPGVRWACPRWVDASFVNLTNITGVTQRPLLFPFGCDGNLTGGELHWRMSRSTSGSNNFTVHVGIYSHVNETQISLFGSTSAAFSNTATASVSGVRQFEMGVGTGLSTLSQGQWILGLIFSATATASMNYSLMGGATGNPGLGRIDQGSDQYVTYTSHFEMPFWGRFSTTTGALPATIGQSAVIGGLSGASLPMPMHFTLASHY